MVCGQTPGVAICDECVGLCNQIIGAQLAPAAGDQPPAA